MLTCPVCRSPLQPAAVRGQALAACPARHGVWFDRSVLESLMADMPVRSNTSPARFREATVATAMATHFACPGDGHALHHALWGDVSFTRCPSCGGHWLDRAALAAIADEVAGKRLAASGQDPAGSVGSVGWAIFEAYLNA